MSLQQYRRSEEEPLFTYTFGGNHPVNIGDKFNSRYSVVRKLGWGIYSTVWLAEDQIEKRHVALKIIQAEFTGRTAEVDILLKVMAANPEHPGRRHVVSLLDFFQHVGPNGTHDCLVLEPMGQTLEALELARPREHGYRRLPSAVVKQVARQLLLGLDYLHTVCGVIQTDLKPDNTLIALPYAEALIRKELSAHPPKEVPPPAGSQYPIMRYSSQPLKSPAVDASSIVAKMADFGTSNWANKHFLEEIQPPALRAPEVILRAPWNASADIWNLGCLIFELLTGRVLFTWPDTEGYPVEDAHLWQMMGLLGAFPRDLLSSGKRTREFFDENGKLIKIANYIPYSIEQLNTACMLPGTPSEEVAEFSAFLGSMLRLRPSERLSARELLNHPWLRG